MAKGNLALAAVLLGGVLVLHVCGDDADKQFEQFMKDFQKDYDGAEKEVRREAFKNNLRYIEEENKKGHTYTLGITEFADMTSDEFALTHLGLAAPEKVWGNLPHLGTHEYKNGPLADSVDWRAKGAVTDIKNQAQCGSCWAFSTTGSLEGAWQIKTGNLLSLSEQQLVDCSKAFGNKGCSGGLMDNGFKYAEQAAMCTEASYPYKAKNGICQASKCTVGIPKGGVTGYKDVASNTQSLMDAVQLGPVSIAIEADKSVFQLYKKGVLSGACGSKLDHGVLAVGYGTMSGQDYWIVKNSWGKQWGMEGYGLLLRGKAGTGECGIKAQPSYPVVSGKPGPAPGPTPPTPTPPPTPPTPGTYHYEKPPCQSDEVEAQVQGADGAVCAPSCDTGTCPTDVPPGTKAKPQCILQDSSTHKKYCALECVLVGCPTGAKCAMVGGIVGVCVYPTTDTSKVLEFKADEPDINV